MSRGRDADAAVASMLHSLPVPEHSDDFFDRLRMRLLDEDGGPAGVPSTVIDLALRRGAQQVPRRGLARAMRLATAPAVAAACFVLVVGGALVARRGIDITHRVDAGPAGGAGELTSATARRLSVPTPYTPAKTGLRVKFHTFTADRAIRDQQYEAIISPSGDYHISRLSPRLDLNFSAKANARTMYHDEDAKAPELLTQTDLPLGPPEGRELLNPTATLSRDLGAAVRAIAAERPGAVKNVTWKDRPALELTEENGGGTYLQYQYLKVDVKTGIPLEIKQITADGSLLHTLVVDDLREQSLAGDVLAPTLLPAANARPEPKSFAATTIPDAARAVGYAPLRPLWAPAGFALANVAVAQTVPRIEDQTNPTYTDVVALVYRNGFDSFTVTTRRAAPGSGAVDWQNPLLQGTSLPDRSEVTAVKEGALAGAEVHVGIFPLVWPHVWAKQGDLVVTIAGDLTRAQLLEVTKSLQAYLP